MTGWQCSLGSNDGLDAPVLRRDVDGNAQRTPHCTPNGRLPVRKSPTIIDLEQPTLPTVRILTGR